MNSSLRLLEFRAELCELPRILSQLLEFSIFSTFNPIKLESWSSSFWLPPLFLDFSRFFLPLRDVEMLLEFRPELLWFKLRELPKILSQLLELSLFSLFIPIKLKSWSSSRWVLPLLLDLSRLFFPLWDEEMLLLLSSDKGFWRKSSSWKLLLRRLPGKVLTFLHFWRTTKGY